MSVFHQIGHDSENLLFEDDLSRFAGAVLSPLNYTPAEVAAQLEMLKDRESFVTIFDPHLYRPQSERMCLPKWSYYPKDIETNDLTPALWHATIDKVAETAIGLGTDFVASPAIAPKYFPDEYFEDLVGAGDRLAAALRGKDITPMQTVVANMADLSAPSRAMAIASIVSRSKCPECLLVFVSTARPGREIAESEELKGAMRMIAALESGGQKVTVAFSSADVVLWKAAGATNCASGKFFNLRRFTISRFDEPKGEGGGQLPYLFEEALLAFLRQSDILKVRDKGFFSAATNGNPFSKQILEAMPLKQAWVRFGWRHYLYWFADIEARIASGTTSALDIVKTADENWGAIEKLDPPFYMEDRQTDGVWVRQWRRAIVEFPHFR
jgi:hypothetical protein